MTQFFKLVLFSYILIFLSLLPSAASAQSTQPELWYWQGAYPLSASDVAATEAQIDQAYSYGYTGVAFWSATFDFMASPVHPAPNVAYMQQLVNYAVSKGMKTMGTVAPYGYSDDVLLNNPNWAEGEHITGSQFTVNSAKTQLVPVNSFSGLANPGFEQGLTAWFSWGDPNMGIDTTVHHSGTASGVVTNAAGNARFTQVVNLTPWRQYHGRAFYKTSNFRGYSQIEVWDSTTNILLYNLPINVQSTQDWTELDFTFNSRTSTQPTLLFGVWGGSSGSMWWDDMFIEETSLVYALRRSGTPLVAYDPNNPGTIYQEGTDFNTITDPNFLSGANFSDQYHTPAVVTLPSTTRMAAGQKVAIDYYAVQPVQANGSDVGMCLTEAATQSFIQQNAQSITSSMPAAMGYLISYDEMRHMDSCASCKAKGMTPGQLLAWHAGQTYNMYLSLAPSPTYYMWSDMFDPNMNAHDNYYFVEGNISGSWAGLPPAVTVMNWNLGNLTTSLNWFAGTNSQQPTKYRQIIAGYYDSGNGSGSATQEIQAAFGIPGVAGLMYTTWNTDYTQLKPFADAVKTNWPLYLASLPQTTGTLSGTVQNTAGAGLSGASVHVVGGSVNTTVATASNGTYQVPSLPAGTYTVTASLAGYNAGSSSATIPSSGGNVTLNFTLTPVVGSLSGTVQNSAGTGLAGASVHVVGGSVNTTVVTASNGTYQVPSLPPGTYTVTASLAGYNAGSSSATIPSGGGNVTLNFTLTPVVGSLSGTVQNAAGTGLAGASVHVVGGSINTTVATASNGAYQVPSLPPGTYTVTASLAGYNAGSSSATITGSGGNVTLNFTLTPVVGSLSGTVQNSAGTGLSGASVHVVGGSINTTVATASNGTYQVPSLPPGTYTVTASLTGYTPVTVSATIPSGGGNVTLNFTLTPVVGSLSGTVQNSAGTGLSGASVQVLGGSINTTVTAASNGTYQVPNLSPGTYTVTASLTGYTPVTVSATIPSSGGTVTQNFTLAAAFTTIRVDAGGGPYTDINGNVWSADAGFTGGQASTSSFLISGTNDPTLYQTQRFSTAPITYTFAVPAGTYYVRLKFAQTILANNKNTFNVSINGAGWLSNFNIFALVGSLNAAVDQVTTVTESTGSIAIQFTPTLGNATVAGIEISKTADPAFLPFHINSGGTALTDGSGVYWAGDMDYSGGTPFSNPVTIQGTTVQPVYQTGRYDAKRLTYQLYAPSGNYTLTAHYAQPTPGSVPHCVFDVAINGLTMLSSFDPMTVAGANVAVDRQFAVTGSAFIVTETARSGCALINGIDLAAR